MLNNPQFVEGKLGDTMLKNTFKSFRFKDVTVTRNTENEQVSHSCFSVDEPLGLHDEIWENGETDVFLTCDSPDEVISDLWLAN